MRFRTNWLTMIHVLSRAHGTLPRSEPERTGRLLVVEDDDDTRFALFDALHDLGHEVELQPDAEGALRQIERSDFDAVLTDVRMPRVDGIELCRRLTGNRPGLPILVMTAFGDVESAMGALRAGAFDFITKPFTLDQVARALARALRQAGQSPTLVRANPTSRSIETIEGLIGASPAMRLVMEGVAVAAPAELTVLITGESGTGKELVARAVHRASGRSGPFLPVSCAAVPADILEAELFGHLKGAFTGAATSRPGLLQQAEGGTLFLDEIGDMPLELQPKLLRVLQERRLRPIGSAQEIPFDARLVAATNRDLRQAVLDGTFRQDLYFRLNVFHLHLPALRDREGDALELARHFLSGLAGTRGRKYRLTGDAEQLIQAHPWPGNVRELENCIQGAVALASKDEIDAADLPTTSLSTQRTEQLPRGEGQTLEDVERHHILRVLRAVLWNKAEAARALGINRATLYRKMGRYGIKAGSG